MTLPLVQATICQALLAGQYAHVPRADLEDKNWLATRRVSVQQVVDLVNACSPLNHSVSDHHNVSRIKVHELKVHHSVLDHDTWYLKFYYQPNSPQGWKVFSVHPSR